MSWQFFLIIAIVTEALGRIMQRVLLKDDKSNPIAYAIIFQLLVGLMIGIYAFFTGFRVPPLGMILPNLLLMPILYGLANIFIFKSLKMTEASVFTILFTTRIVWIVLGAIFLLHESFTSIQFIGTLLLICSVVLVSWKKQKVRFSKGEIFAVLGAVTFGIAIVNDSIILKSFDVASYLTISFLAPGLFILALYPKSGGEVMRIVKSPVMKKILLLSVVYGIDAIAYFTAYRTGNNAAQLASLFQITTILTVFLSILILKEKTNLSLKIIAAILSFIGVLLVK